MSQPTTVREYSSPRWYRRHVSPKTASWDRQRPGPWCETHHCSVETLRALRWWRELPCCFLAIVKIAKRLLWLKVTSERGYTKDIKKVQIVQNARKERKLASGISQLAFIKVCQIPLALFPTRRTSYYFLLFFSELLVYSVYFIFSLFPNKAFVIQKWKVLRTEKWKIVNLKQWSNSYALWR